MEELLETRTCFTPAIYQPYDLTTANKIVDLLNELVRLDKTAMGALLSNRVPCNQDVSEHPTVQVVAQNNGYYLGLLGILNGLCGEHNGYGCITAVFEDVPNQNWKNLSHFEVKTQWE